MTDENKEDDVAPLIDSWPGGTENSVCQVAAGEALSQLQQLMSRISQDSKDYSDILAFRGRWMSDEEPFLWYPFRTANEIRNQENQLRMICNDLKNSKIFVQLHEATNEMFRLKALLDSYTCDDCTGDFTALSSDIQALSDKVDGIETDLTPIVDSFNTFKSNYCPAKA